MIKTYKVDYLQTFSRPEEILALMDFEFIKAMVINTIAPQNMEVKEKLHVLQNIFDDRKNVDLLKTQNSDVFKMYYRKRTLTQNENQMNLIKVLKVKKLELHMEKKYSCCGEQKVELVFKCGQGEVRKVLKNKARSYEEVFYPELDIVMIGNLLDVDLIFDDSHKRTANITIDEAPRQG